MIEIYVDDEDCSVITMHGAESAKTSDDSKFLIATNSIGLEIGRFRWECIQGWAQESERSFDSDSDDN